MRAEVVTGGFRPAQRLMDLANLIQRDPRAPRGVIATVLSAHGESSGDLACLDDAECDKVRAVITQMIAVLRETDIDRAAAGINDVLDVYASRPRLSNHDGHIWHLHVDHGQDTNWADWLASSSALALAQLLSVHGRLVWGECAATACQTLFLESGPGSPRRFCSSTCATRDRVAKHRAKRSRPASV